MMRQHKFICFSFFISFLFGGFIMNAGANTISSDMNNNSTSATQLLSAAYSAFNARDIDAAVLLMSPDVTWPKAFKGGVVNGPNEIRAYWTEQWSEINPSVEPMAFYPQNDSKILVDVHQVVRSLDGQIISDEHVCHRFTIKNELIQAMELCSFP
jgi:hypothetical protein